jgi:hypothetical protein
MEKIIMKMDNLTTIGKAVRELGADAEAITLRSLVESSIQESVVAFQFFCETYFIKLFPTVAVKANPFQNLIRGGEYWKKYLGESYEDWLDKREYQQLNILFQKRHLLAHKEGLVDQKYIDQSGDTSYKPGQRIVVKKADVLLLVKLIKKIVDKLLLVRNSI